MKKFYRLDGSSVRVTEQEYNRRKKRQAARIRKRGLEVWEDRRGRQRAVTKKRLFGLKTQRLEAKQAAKTSWADVKSKRLGRVRRYVGPTMEIRSKIDQKEFREKLFDFAKIALVKDGRLDKLKIQAEIESTAYFRNEEVGQTTIVVDLLLANKGKVLTASKKKAFTFSMAPLVEDIRGLKADSPKKAVATGEAELDDMFSELDHEAQADHAQGIDENGAVADFGAFGVFDSTIIISQV